MVADDTGNMVSEVRYSAFGESQYEFGTVTTDYLYTGQRQEVEIDVVLYSGGSGHPGRIRFLFD